MGVAHPHRAHIAPVAAGIPRPLWSVMIPTYNCAHLLQETLSGVLVQDPGANRMQIEVVDDHSTDNPESVVDAFGGRVGFYRQPGNVGHTENFRTCLERAQGELVHLLHGDDLVLPGFYQTMERAFSQNEAIGAAFCRHVFVDGEGHWKSISPLEQRTSGILENGLERLAREQRIMTPSIVVRRHVYEALGGFDDRLICSEDWEMWVRIAANYPIWYEPEPLALYRMHTNSNTGRHVRSGEDITFTCRAIDMFTPYLPEALADRVTTAAKTTYAFSALKTAKNAFSTGDLTAGRAQVRAALLCSRSLPVVMSAARVITSAARQSLRRSISESRP